MSDPRWTLWYDDYVSESGNGSLQNATLAGRPVRIEAEFAGNGGVLDIPEDATPIFFLRRRHLAAISPEQGYVHSVCMAVQHADGSVNAMWFHRDGWALQCNSLDPPEMNV